ncbi:hypothetical protein [Paraburkholderia sp. BCC1884]|uniref:hypothetical protein n=1 Tax=Paraburkholderia sp. BCC1884 TaxID=2562668 RepID=UPI0011829ABB|nr:hypothetical protein [Paraburkholderia sp. BCC1884]
MRLAFRIDLSSIANRAACCAAIALIVLPAGAQAQVAAPALSATLAENADTGPARFSNAVFTVPAASDTVIGVAGQIRLLASTMRNLPADSAQVNDFSLDDQALSRQRGGAVGMLMVAATPQLMRGNGAGNNVTLWDEIAPPSSPLPIPVDAARSAQGNVASYQRK